MTTFEERTYIPSSETDDRFIPNFSQEKKDLLNQYTPANYGELLTPLEMNQYSTVKFSMEALQENSLGINDTSSFTTDDSNLPPFEVKEQFSEYITMTFKNILRDMCTLSDEFKEAIVVVNKDDIYPKFINWTCVAKIALTRFDRLIALAGINPRHLHIKSIRQDLYSIVVLLCSHYYVGMKVGLRMNYTNVDMWRKRAEFDTAWAEATYDHATTLRMANMLGTLHVDDRQKKITNIRNSFDTYLERLWVYVGKEQKKEEGIDMVTNDSTEVKQITTGVEQVNLSSM